jgi:hypothetical protein
MDQVDVASHVGALWWGRELFFTNDTADRRVPEVIDVTGRSRFLFAGPYVNLPAGLWRASVFLDICPEAARRKLAVQLGVEPDYTTVDLTQGQAGPQAVQVEHLMSGDGHAQVRLWLKRAGFHGEIRFSGVALEPTG